MNSHQCLATAVLLCCSTAATAQDGYLLFRGNAQRTGDATKMPAWKKRTAFQRPLLKDKLDGTNEADNDDAAEALIAKLRKDSDPTILPASFPIIVNGLCVYRRYRDVGAVALQQHDIKAEGEVIHVGPGEFMWRTIVLDRSLANLAERPQTRRAIELSAETLRARKQESFLWANGLIGSLSSDGTAVFGINDCAFPSQLVIKNHPTSRELNALQPFAMENELVAWQARTGKELWRTRDWAEAKSPLSGGHYLGAPLSIDNRLHVLHEKAGELSLLRIDMDVKKWRVTWAPDLDKASALMRIPADEQILNSPLRRTQALQIAQAGDLLVCPTHAGVLVGVDRATMNIRWQYRYRDANVPAPAQPYWQAACPIVHKDQIIFTAADSPDVYCIGLDGKKKWTAPVVNGLYAATVADDYVFVVGKGTCRALKLADGTEKWKVEMGAPAGVGVRDGDLYFLPLQKDGINNAPTIWAFDLNKGGKAYRVPVPHPESLGNLALHRGVLVSQSVTHIAAFPVTMK